MSFIHSVSQSEFISTYGYMYGFHIVCLISSMDLDRCLNILYLIIFDYV